MNTTTGTYVAVIGFVVAALAHFGLVFNADQVGQTISDGIQFASDLAVIYGIIHQFFVTKKIVAAARAAGMHI